MEKIEQTTPPPSPQKDAPSDTYGLADLIRPMGLVLVLYFLAATAYMVATPIFEKPDEPQHFAFATYLAKHNYRLPDLNSLPPDYFAEQEGTQAPLFYLMFAAVLNTLDFQLEDSDYAYLFQGNHQKGWHLESALSPDNFNGFVGGRCLNKTCESMKLAVYVGRALNIVIGAMSVIATAVAVKISFPQQIYLAVLVAVMIAFTPQFLHVTSGVNNDILTVFGINLSLALGMWWLRHPHSTGSVIAFGCVVGITALSKARR